jgi:putative sigma-54 modulation protein
MKAVITSVKFKSDKKLEEFVQEKIDKITPIFDGINSCSVILRLNKNNKNLNKVAEIKLGIIGKDIVSKKYAKTFEEAIDNSIEALRKQLIKRKEKIKKI